MISDQTWAIAILGVYGTFGVFWLLQWWLAHHIQGLALLIFGRPGPASSIYFFMLAPGVVIHELSHWLFAKLLLVRTGDMALFRPGARNSAAKGKITLGYVEIYHSDPVRQSLIGLAPLPVGIIVLLLLATLLGFNRDVSQEIAAGNQWQILSTLPGQFIASLGHPLNFLWLYLAFTVSNGMLPSAPDRRPWLVGFILPSLVIGGLTLGGGIKLPMGTQQNLLGILGTLTWVFAFVAVLNLLLALIIATLEYLVSHFSRRHIVYRR